MYKVFPFILAVFFTTNLLPQQLNTKLQSIAGTYQTTGMSVVVVKNDSLVFQGYYGKRDIARNLPINQSTMYRIASISKFITATTLMTLYDQGLFHLDDDVSTYLGFTLRNPSFPSDPITFRKLLSHTSSLRDGTAYDGFLSQTASSNPPPTLQSLLTSTGSLFSADMFSASRGPASSYFTYANINFGVIGTLIEKISGQRFDIAVRNRVLIPLGITGSFNIQDLSEINNLAALYRKSGGQWVAQADNYAGVKPPARDLSQYTLGTNGLIFSPTGGLRVSAADLARIMQLHANGGVLHGIRIISDSTMQKMHQPVWTYNGNNGNNYYGIFNTYAIGNHTTTDLLPGESLIGHPGEAYGLISDLYYSPAKKYGIIFMVNGAVWGNGNYSGWYNLEEDVYKACLEELPNFVTAVESESGDLKTFGLHPNYPNPFNPTTRIRFTITSRDAGLVSLKLFTPQGKEVLSILEQPLPAGTYETDVNLSAASFTSGVYFCRLQSGGFIDAQKLMLLK